MYTYTGCLFYNLPPKLSKKRDGFEKMTETGQEVCCGKCYNEKSLSFNPLTSTSTILKFLNEDGG